MTPQPRWPASSRQAGNHVLNHLSGIPCLPHKCDSFWKLPRTVIILRSPPLSPERARRVQPSLTPGCGSPARCLNTRSCLRLSGARDGSGPVCHWQAVPWGRGPWLWPGMKCHDDDLPELAYHHVASCSNVGDSGSRGWSLQNDSPQNCTPAHCRDFCVSHTQSDGRVLCLPYQAAGPTPRTLEFCPVSCLLSPAQLSET